MNLIAGRNKLKENKILRRWHSRDNHNVCIRMSEGISTLHVFIKNKHFVSFK